jgi:ATP-dependent Zn protease
LIDHRDDLDALATVLLERETIDRADFDAYFSRSETVELNPEPAEA